MTTITPGDHTTAASVRDRRPPALDTWLDLADPPTPPRPRWWHLELADQQLFDFRFDFDRSCALRCIRCRGPVEGKIIVDRFIGTARGTGRAEIEVVAVGPFGQRSEPVTVCVDVAPSEGLQPPETPSPPARRVATPIT